MNSSSLMKYIFITLFYLAISETWGVFGQNFSERQLISASDAHSGDNFGSFVNLKDNFILISAPRHYYDLNGNNFQDQAGAAYSYTLNKDSLFTNEQKLISTDRFTMEQFGWSSAMGKDVLAIGADGSHLDENQTNFFLYAGAVYIGRKNSSGEWSINQKIVATFRNSGDRFGTSISIAGDILAVGAPHHDMDSTGIVATDAGSVFLFRKDAALNYSLYSHITASDRSIVSNFGNSFGSCVHFQDSLNLFIGAELEGGYHGAVYYYIKNSSDQWIEQQKLVASNREFDPRFGHSLSGSGDYLSIGAYWDKLDNDGQNSKNACGSVYIFKKDNMGVWKQSQRLVAPFREGHMEYGKSIAMQGRILVVGSPGASSDENNTDSIRKAGSAFVYYLDDNNTWQFVQKLVKQDRKISDGFGASISLHNNLLAVGSAQLTPFGFTNIYSGSNPFTGFKLVNNELNPDVSVYPNPNNGIFTIKTNRLKLDRLLIYDVNSRLVYEENLKGKENSEVHLPANILNGLYLVRIESGREAVNKKLLVNGR